MLYAFEEVCESGKLETATAVKGIVVVARRWFTLITWKRVPYLNDTFHDDYRWVGLGSVRKVEEERYQYLHIANSPINTLFTVHWSQVTGH
jgi:hypothetical protein